MRLYRHVGLILLITGLGAFVFTTLALANASGRFVAWKFLGKPPGKVVEIGASGYVLTDSGELYKLNYLKSCLRGCWDKAISAAPVEGSYVVPVDGCADIMPYLGYFRQTKIICRLEFASSLTVYGIGLDGFVYAWHFQSGEPIYVLYSPFLGAIFGFAMAVLLIVMRQPVIWQDTK